MDEKKKEIMEGMTDMLLKMVGADVAVPQELANKICSVLNEKEKAAYSKAKEAISGLESDEKETVIRAIVSTTLTPTQLRGVSKTASMTTQLILEYLHAHPEHRAKENFSGIGE